MSDNDRNNTVRDPSHPEYGKDTRNKPIRQELAARDAQLRDTLPNPTTLLRNEDFQAGKKVEFGGLMVNMNTPASTMFGADRAPSRTLQHRRIADGIAVFNPDSPSETNMAQINRSGGNTNMAASYTAEPDKIISSMALELAMLNSATKQDLIHKTVTIETRGAARDPRRKMRTDPYKSTWEYRQKNKAKALAAEPDKRWAPLPDRCANCNQFGHKAIHCWGPTDIYGFINTCPCNGPGHLPDQCAIVKTWSNLLKYKIFYLYRVGLPQFKLDQSFIHLIIHDPVIRELHNVIKFAMRTGCPNDISLSWRYNPLTKHFSMQTWNHAKPWKYHDYNKPQERWCNLPDPAYQAENWLEQAMTELPLNPLGQSFINRRTERDLPGMQASWKILRECQVKGETTNLPILQENMQAWSTFYDTMDDEPTAYMEWMFQKLSHFTDAELDALRQMGPQNCDTILQAFYKSEKSMKLTAKPGIGVPQVPQTESDMMTGTYFAPSRVA